MEVKLSRDIDAVEMKGCDVNVGEFCGFIP
jgi:hypothetical protein